MNTVLSFPKAVSLWVILFAITSLPSRSIAFGPVGHEAIAYIAQDRLSPAALAKIREILDREEDLAEVANWADAIRPFQEETKPWHFIDLPIRQNVQLRDVLDFCPNNDCVIAQIQIKKGVLTDPSQPKREKVRALKFLIHFVGDLHQPLHTADDADRGGNDKLVRFRNKKMKLHAVWDGLIEKEVVEDPREFATRLQTDITTAKAKTWALGDETDWAMEGYKIAKETIYRVTSLGLKI